MNAEIRPRIMVVDDDADDIVLVTRAARRFAPRWELREALGGNAALAVLASGWLPQVMLLDQHMPGMDGHAVIASVRDNVAWRPIRIALLSGSIDHADLERAFVAGASAVFVKPTSADGYERIMRQVAALDPALALVADGAEAEAETADGCPDLRLVAIAKRCLRGSGRAKRSTLIAAIAEVTGCSLHDAGGHLGHLQRAGYIEQVGYGDEAVVSPGPNLSSLVLRAIGQGILDKS